MRNGCGVCLRRIYLGRIHWRRVGGKGRGGGSRFFNGNHCRRGRKRSRHLRQPREVEVIPILSDPPVDHVRDILGDLSNDGIIRRQLKRRMDLVQGAERLGRGAAYPGIPHCTALPADPQSLRATAHHPV